MARRTLIRIRVNPPVSQWAASDFDEDGTLNPTRDPATDGPPLTFGSGGVHEVDVTGNPALKQAIADAVAADVGVELVHGED